MNNILIAGLVFVLVTAGGCSHVGGEEHISITNSIKQEVNAVIKEHKSGDWSPDLSMEEQRTLFAIARDTLRKIITGGGGLSFDGYEITDKLKNNCATFVTFKNGDRLRGCMGCLEAVEPMAMSVQRSAANASRDSRFAFDPIKESEMKEINIHVSLLSPRRKINSLDEFKLGQHGIWIEKGGAGAVFLPEVAPEQGWTKEQTLQHLCMKAGLGLNEWKSGMTFMVFESVVLSEE